MSHSVKWSLCAAVLAMAFATATCAQEILPFPDVMDALEHDLIGSAEDEPDGRPEAIRLAAVCVGHPFGDGAQIIDIGCGKGHQLSQRLNHNRAGDRAEGVGIGQDGFRGEKPDECEDLVE